MSYKFSKAKKDTNHDAIKSSLTNAGLFVRDMHGVGNDYPDLFTHNGKDVVLLEIKTNDPAAFFYVSQLKFIAEYPGYIAFVSDELKAINIVRSPMLYALSEKEKSKILKIVLECENGQQRKIRVSAFEKRFGRL